MTLSLPGQSPDPELADSAVLPPPAGWPAPPTPAVYHELRERHDAPRSSTTRHVPAKRPLAARRR
jgi:hypothetical protein